MYFSSHRVSNNENINIKSISKRLSNKPEVFAQKNQILKTVRKTAKENGYIIGKQRKVLTTRQKINITTNISENHIERILLYIIIFYYEGAEQS